MCKFCELEKESNYEMDKRISKYWKDNNIFEKSIDSKDENFVFYDGPIYANAKPGLHHMFAKEIKDAFFETFNRILIVNNSIVKE